MQKFLAITILVLLCLVAYVKPQLRLSSCATVRCSSCHECKENRLGQPRCVYRNGCCPTGQSQVNCFISPCQFGTKNCKEATTCIANYCGGCNKKFYDDLWNEIPESSCTPEDVRVDEPVVSSNDPCDGVRCRRGKVCKPSIRQCIRAPCPQYICEDGPVVASSDPCDGVNCGRGKVCQPSNLRCFRAPCPQHICVDEPVVASNDPCDGVNCGRGKVCQPSRRMCFRAPCPQHICVDEPVVASSDPCDGVNCGRGKVCQPSRRMCFRAPCPQHICVDQPVANNNPCDGVKCGLGKVCQPSKRMCFTTPCPQYICVDEPRVQPAGCAAVLCVPGTTCQEHNGQASCVPSKDVPAQCLLPPVVGPCEALFPSFYYNKKAGQCDSFNYGGCQGNDNRFETREWCERVCVENRQCMIPPVARPPEGCNWETRTDDEGCMQFVKIVCEKSCPLISRGTFGICVESCSSDEECKDDEKCCSNGCGHACMKAVSNSPFTL